ncbi:hypothetical protein glysoja_039447 [Glycine soja]|uniref:Uncharacterized protein n=1 Tax=Glycine soja TaxID=3848 RepID=A0A0B2QYZ2_GLYSO|nr:hypothetical protein glysoja_039447 [Glycine soja]
MSNLRYVVGHIEVWYDTNNMHALFTYLQFYHGCATLSTSLAVKNSPLQLVLEVNMGISKLFPV